MSKPITESKYELNKALALALGLMVQEIDDSKVLGMTSNYHTKYPDTVWAATKNAAGKQSSAWEQICYTNTWGDIGPLIEEKNISLMKDDDLWEASIDFQGDVLKHGTDETLTKCYEHTSPTYAATMVLLLFLRDTT